MELQTKLSVLSGIGPVMAKRLAYLNLITVEDLIYYFPFRYDDFANTTTVSQLTPGTEVTLQGEIWSIKNSFTRVGRVITKAVFNDSSGTLELIWFNQSYLTKTIKTGDRLQIAGKVIKYKNKLSIMVPKWEKLADETSEAKSLHTGRLVPIYPETYGLTSKWLRQKIALLLPLTLANIQDPLPDHLRKGGLSLTEALSQIHYPDNQAQLELAIKRLSFDELFYLQLLSQKRRMDWQNKKLTTAITPDQEKLAAFIKNLPFELTNAQKKVINEITIDLAKEQPMNRLLQGEVGSGKTVVAAAAIYLTYLNNLNSVVMAPTEILAFQHYATLSKLLSSYGISVGIYTGSKKYVGSKGLGVGRQIQEPSPHTEHPTPNIIVGTHALLSDKLNLDTVGLVVVDEQQRFGVEQRSLLRAKTNTPHFLTMTATPIPRTVALTIYGDLDLSIIDELPKGRMLVKTFFVPQKKRADAYKFIAGHLLKGEQAYVITPLIEPSETLKSAKAAKLEYERLKKTVFPEFCLGLLHGRLKAKEKEAVMSDFKDHKIDILVSTSVVEVGMDVPNATIMVIEGSERFGLAQLHQFRGRVGRGLVQSYAFLFTESENHSVVSRIKHLENTYNGLELAELDLKIRGSGEIFGTAQSGQWNLKLASLLDLPLIEETKEAALNILLESPTLDKYPALAGKLSDRANIMPD